MRRKLGNSGAFTANFPNPVWITNSGGMLLVTTILGLIPTLSGDQSNFYQELETRKKYKIWISWDVGGG